MTIFTNQEISRTNLDVWLFLKSGKIWPLCTPSLEWQQRAFPPTPATRQAPFRRKPVPGWWITSVPTTSCYCASVRMCAGGWLYPLTLPAFLQKAFGFLASTLRFVFPEISSLPFPVAANLSLHFFFYFSCSMSWCNCRPWLRSVATGVFLLRAFKLFCAKIHIWHRKHCLPVCLKIKSIYT